MFTTIRSWLSLWLVMCITALPLSTYVLPPVGKWISYGMNYLTQPLSLLLFGTETSHSYLVSDSAALYAEALIFLLFALAIVLFFRYRYGVFQPRLRLISYYGLVYLIAFYLLRYGLDKLAGNQFYVPASNTLFTPVGQLSKDILFWSSMGTSRFYNIFMGSTEVLAAVLLLFQRTRFLGSLFAAGICLHIFAINVGFDITVKYLSGILLLGSVVLLSYFPGQLALLLQLKTKRIFQAVSFRHSRKTHLLKGVLILFLLVECLLPFESYHRRSSGTSYEVVAFEGQSNRWNLDALQRIHFHPQGYLITESSNQVFRSERYSITGNRLTVGGTSMQFGGKKLSWQEGNQENYVLLRPIPLNTLPALQDDCHWTVESLLKAN